MIVAIHKNFVTHHHQVYISDMMIVMYFFVRMLRFVPLSIKNNVTWTAGSILFPFKYSSHSAILFIYSRAQLCNCTSFETTNVRGALFFEKILFGLLLIRKNISSIDIWVICGKLVLPEYCIFLNALFFYMLF